MSHKVTIIGAGIAGLSTAFFLAQKGYEVAIVDTKIGETTNNKSPLNGSEASLGVLMGNIYRRTSGRSWRLRQRSMQLWPLWVNQLSVIERKLCIKTPLLQLARSEEEGEFMKKIAKDKNRLGIKFLEKNRNYSLNALIPENQYGATISYNDGRIDINKLINSLKVALKKLMVESKQGSVIKIIKGSDSHNKRWEICLNNGEILKQNTLIICNGIKSADLIKTLGHKIELEAVLGQAVEIELKENNYNCNNWPAVISYCGINLIPTNENRLLIGATLETGTTPNIDAKSTMLKFNNNQPYWIKNASIIKEWHGLRAKPINQPAPILMTLERGLLINSGHYRNGVLIAPACAEWIEVELKKEINK